MKPELSPAMEEKVREVALQFHAGFHATTSVPCAICEKETPIFRALVLAAVQETARRCADAIQEEAHSEEGAAMQLDRGGFAEGLVIAARGRADGFRRAEKRIRKEFLSDAD